MGGFDTTPTRAPNGGHLFEQFTQIAQALRAFFDDLGDARKNVTVVLSSEFGRRVAQNGGGTDHGHGNVVTILSGKKLAGSLLGKWDGLNSLDNGDVPEFNNMFDVFGTVAQSRFGLSTAEVAAIFPKRTFAPVKLFAYDFRTLQPRPHGTGRAGETGAARCVTPRRPRFFFLSWAGALPRLMTPEGRFGGGGARVRHSPAPPPGETYSASRVLPAEGVA